MFNSLPDQLGRVVQRCLGYWLSAFTRALSLALMLTLVLGLIRALQTWHYTPPGAHFSAADLFAAWLRGTRFDLKVAATAALLLESVLGVVPARLAGWLRGTLCTAFVLLGIVNYHYYGFYKTPIDPLVFGLKDDDTLAVLQTAWLDFPVLTSLLVCALLVLATMRGASALQRGVVARATNQVRGLFMRAALVVGIGVLLLFAAKGTLHGMALQQQHIGVTTEPFLNDMVPNGVIALKYAWDNDKLSHDFSDDEAGVRALGFKSVLEAAIAAGLPAHDRDELRHALYVGTTQTDRAAADTPHKNLVFVQMESWSAEPLRYQSAGFNVLGALEQPLQSAYRFSSFDSAANGTHPTLEAVMFATPITPLTQGPSGRQPMPWAVAAVLKRAGYDTVFATTGQAGWRNLNHVLLKQGFDEVIDAPALRKRYPQAEGGIWGLWDEYLFRYIEERIRAQPAGRPLFVFAMTTTNHPPYQLPADYTPPTLDLSQWRGESDSPALLANLNTYRYVNEQLGQFVGRLQSQAVLSNTVLAATGDHNVRTFGLYITPERRPLRNQVPFVVWAPSGLCRDLLDQPASHRDMYPTLFPLVGVTQGFLNTGRNLFDCAAAPPQPWVRPARSLSYSGQVRSVEGVWTLGDAASFVCTRSATADASGCRFSARDDTQERAYWALMDWHIRSALKPTRLLNSALPQ